MSTTQQDLAERLGLSLSTVSQALAGRGRIAEQTRRRVLEEAARLGYRIDGNARAIRTGRSGLIGLLTIVPDWKGPLSRDLLTGIIEGLTQADATAVMATVDLEGLRRLDAVEHLTQLPPLLRQRLCDGFLVNYHLPPDPLLAAAVARSGPAIWLNCRCETDAIFLDERSAAHAVTTRLIAAGHRRLGYVDYHHPEVQVAQAHHSVGDRRAGFRAACREAGIEPLVLCPEQRLDEAGNLAFTRAWMGASDRPEAVLCYAAGRDVTCTQIVAAELGLRIPEDLGLVQFAGRPHENGLRVDTVTLPWRELGREAAQMVLARVGTPAAVPARQLACGFEGGWTSRLG